MIKVHEFRSSREAYGATQCDEAIQDGDVLFVPSEGVAGFLHKAWPVAVTSEAGQFHTLAEDADITKLGAKPEKRMWLAIWCLGDYFPVWQEEVFPADPGTDYSEAAEQARNIANGLGFKTTNNR